MPECIVKNRYFQRFLTYLVTYLCIFIYLLILFTYVFCVNMKNGIRRDALF